jgi:cytochrome c biogenesis protein CcdA
MTKLTLPIIILGAIGDSINPCAIAVLIFITTYLIAVKKRGKDFLAIGLVYVLFIYITYFLAGIGLLSFIKKIGISDYVFYITAVAVIIAGLINIKDVIFSQSGFILSIPESKKEIIKKYIVKASVPAAMILGVIVSALELPCTGGIYIAVLGLLANQATLTQGYIYLLIYNLIFVMPLIFILFITYFSLTSETINSWRKKNKRVKS